MITNVSYDTSNKKSNFETRNIEYDSLFYIKISSPLSKKSIEDENFDYFSNMFFLIIGEAVETYVFRVDKSKSKYIRYRIVHLLYRDVIMNLSQKIGLYKDLETTSYLLDNRICQNLAFCQSIIVKRKTKISEAKLIDMAERFLLTLLDKLVKERHSVSNDLMDFSLKSFNLHEEMETDLFSKYYEAGIVMGLSEKQAKLFTTIALDIDNKTAMEITGTNRNNIGGLRREVGKKLRFQDVPKAYKNALIKELAQQFENPKVLEAAKKFFQTDITGKIEVIKEYAENKQIADIVRANPELLQAYLQMQQNQQD